MDNCILCKKSPLSDLLIVPEPASFEECVKCKMFNIQRKYYIPLCDIEYRIARGSTRGRTMLNETGLGDKDCAAYDIKTELNGPQLDRSIADSFWMCGNDKLLNVLPDGWTGLCTLVRAIQQVTIIKSPHDDYVNSRVKRAYEKDTEVYFDAIGQPRGVPREFKARDEVKSGFESIFLWITPNKNLEWMTYIYYNQQRFINYTDSALTALGEQVQDTSKMSYQNRQALNWLFAEKGGVCVMFGDDCCTFIPNNTAPNGSLAIAMAKLKGLREEVKKNAGVDSHVWDWLDLALGKWGAMFARTVFML
ncbi:uncharacterized protein LOC110494027 isoform X2 [Oncorhynchus mykiss]|uniref:uncharacterized protein LOC110494027 isoform X2 n=1 Tax=Oncorhynchus mykiss TaxID=8022 RepID=UPI001877C980|nr:uncharacterized protein LOC110494027 isoform X2 [Oncorhynchus mykiss]